MTRVQVRGFDIHKGYLDTEAQRDLVAEARRIAAAAPLFSPMTPYGKPMRVRMTSAGTYGWISDRSGYRYARTHPNGTAWPPIPERLLSLWTDLTGVDRTPQCCLVNYYGEGARMGLHQDRDEADLAYPVLSVSLGDDGLFRIGGPDRKSGTESFWLQTGDVVIMGGVARLTYHGVDRIRYGSSSLLPQGGRLNLTLRVVD